MPLVKPESIYRDANARARIKLIQKKYRIIGFRLCGRGDLVLPAGGGITAPRIVDDEFRPVGPRFIMAPKIQHPWSLSHVTP